MGTRRVNTIPLKIEITAYSLPDARVMTASVVSIEVAPPAAIGAILPKNLTKTGASKIVIISRIRLEIRAMIPRKSPSICEIITLDRL